MPESEKTTSTWTSEPEAFLKIREGIEQLNLFHESRPKIKKFIKKSFNKINKKKSIIVSDLKIKETKQSSYQLMLFNEEIEITITRKKNYSNNEKKEIEKSIIQDTLFDMVQNEYIEQLKSEYLKLKKELAKKDHKQIQMPQSFFNEAITNPESIIKSLQKDLRHYKKLVQPLKDKEFEELTDLERKIFIANVDNIEYVQTTINQLKTEENTLPQYTYEETLVVMSLSKQLQQNNASPIPYTASSILESLGLPTNNNRQLNNISLATEKLLTRPHRTKIISQSGKIAYFNDPIFRKVSLDDLSRPSNPTEKIRDRKKTYIAFNNPGYIHNQANFYNSIDADIWARLKEYNQRKDKKFTEFYHQLILLIIKNKYGKNRVFKTTLIKILKSTRFDDVVSECGTKIKENKYSEKYIGHILHIAEFLTEISVINTIQIDDEKNVEITFPKIKKPRKKLLPKTK